MTQAVRSHAEEVLREYPGLHQKMVDYLLTLLAEIAVRTHQQVAFFMEMESQHPFTVNAHYLDSQVTKATINLRKKMEAEDMIKARVAKAADQAAKDAVAIKDFKEQVGEYRKTVQTLHMEIDSLRSAND